MKYTLIFIAAVIFIFTACKKKADVTHCYVCVQYDSLYRFSSGAAYNTKPSGISDTLCNMNSNLIQMYVASHLLPDTLYPKTDTLIVGYTTFRCNLSH